MNRAPGVVPVPTGKFVELGLKTIPVGAPATLTLRFTFVPSARYNVEKSAPLWETHHGVHCPETSPHALTRRGSTSRAGGPRMDRRGVMTYVCAFCSAAG